MPLKAASGVEPSPSPAGPSALYALHAVSPSHPTTHEGASANECTSPLLPLRRPIGALLPQDLRINS